ncbi:MAG: glucose-1-phosphate thymidylyltransferase [bacterium]
MLKPEDFFDLSHFGHKAIFEDVEYVWEVLKKIETYIKQVIKPQISGTIMDGAFLIGDNIQIGEGTVVEPGAFIAEPTIIGKNTQIRQGAYVRGSVIVGDECVVGHTTEMKNAIMLNKAKAGHFAYIGDSILGNEVNLGAGTKLANFKFENLSSTVDVRCNDKIYKTGLRKFGAILGDKTETGCNSVMTPGTLLGPKSIVYPNTTVKGYYPAHSIIKLRQNLEVIIQPLISTDK